jgi:hypothetical protein
LRCFGRPRRQPRAGEERTGEAVALDELIRAAWPTSAEWIPKDDLYVLMTRLRRAIDGGSRFGDHIRNRRGYGYVLELAPEEVAIVARLVARAAQDEGDAAVEVPPREIVPGAPPGTVPPGAVATPRDVFPVRRRAWLRPLALAVASVLAVVAAWAIGYSIAGRGGADIRQDAAQPGATETPAPSGERDDEARHGDEQKRNKGSDSDKGRNEGPEGDDTTSPGGSSETTLIASAPSSPTGGAGKETSTSQPSADANDAPVRERKQEEPDPPPQPDAVLYHLVGAEGEHFMTTSSATANQMQAAGYSASNEGHVFSSPVEGTVAIALHEGSAYVYASPGAAPQGTNAAPLYKLSKGGRLFYTTSASLADQARSEGWSQATAGYVLV